MKLLNYYLISICLGLTACSKHHSLLTMDLNDSVHGSIASEFFVGAGQSNMAYMDLNSYFLPQLHNPNAIVMNIAVAGTSLSLWEPGGELYKTMISKIQNRNKPVTAILFWQGENEGLPGGINPETWAERFTNMVNHLRTDLNQPDLPIVFMQIGKNQGYGAAWDTVKDQQASVHMHNVFMVKSDDIEQRFDHLHYTEDGYKILAERLANAYLDRDDI